MSPERTTQMLTPSWRRVYTSRACSMRHARIGGVHAADVLVLEPGARADEDFEQRPVVAFMSAPRMRVLLRPPDAARARCLSRVRVGRLAHPGPSS